MYKKFISQQKIGPETIEKTLSEDSPVLSCWRQIDAEESQYQDWSPPPPRPPGIQGWRTARVFVSSTFSDFFSEREILVKKVFPELREWGSERKIHIIDCDLRWGVPHDSTTGETIAVCLEELDDCHQINEGEPFFLNLMGERYGWIPSKEENTEEVLEKYNWIEGTSITMMEILHGAYRRRNPNAVFFLRNSDFLAFVPDDHLSKFTESEALKQTHLQVLKTRLKKRFPDQLFEYRVQFAGVSSATGTEKVQLTDMDFFASKCLEFFKSAISRKYPQQTGVENLSEEEQEQELQRIFIVEKAELVIGREEEEESLLGYIKDPQSCGLEKISGDKAHLRNIDSWNTCPEDNLICVVQAKSGWGKTSLLAHLTLTALQQGYQLFYHFSGSTSHSRRTTDMLARLLKTLDRDRDNKDEEDEESSSLNQQERLKEALEKFRKSEDKMVIIIDAVNELDLCNSIDHLIWLPPLVPPNVKVIVSCNEHPPTLARLREHPCYWLSVRELAETHMASIAVSYLGRYNKRLDKVQLSALTQGSKVNSPLWMTLICEELRVFGDFRTVTQKIRSLPDTLDGLFGEIFTRLLAEDGTGDVKKSLCLIASSSVGMPTQDLLKLLGNVKTKEEAAPISWALARRHLKPYLRVAGFPDEYVTFSHEKIWKAVRDHVMPTFDEREKWMLHLADFYQYWSNNSTLRGSLLPDLLRNTRQKDRLVEFMRTDRDSWRVAPFRRSDALKWCRCTRPVQGNWSCSPVMICLFCVNKSGCFNPANNRLSKQSCVICGAHCAFFDKATASFCTLHSKAPPNCARCVVCSTIIHLKTKRNGDMEGRLCGQCSVGTFGRMCAFVGGFS